MVKLWSINYLGMLEIVFVYVRDNKNKQGHFGSSDSTLVVVHIPSLAVLTFLRQENIILGWLVM